MNYQEFIDSKSQMGGEYGFEPLWMPDFLFDFQKYQVNWGLRKGRFAGFFDCGLGKSPMELVCAQNVVMKTNGRFLIIMPLAVCGQMKREAEKFGVEVFISRDGKFPDNARIVLTNYQKLHLFNASDFEGCAADESSIIKSFDGATTAVIIRFLSCLRYRQLWTATAAPNDYIELGTSSEALGYLRRVEMLSHYFNHDGGETSKWRLKKHAANHLFWQWVCAWARACKTPSDLGFSDDGYILPPLQTIEHIVRATTKNLDFLFDLPAVGLDEQRKERRRTINERCELAAELCIAHKGSSVAWCHLNPEGDLLEKLIPGAIQVSGEQSDEEKEEKLEAFRTGQATTIVSKSTILGFGQNWQFCDHQTHFSSHSFEQWYQSIRRSWRFGQKNPVRIDVIASEGEAGVLSNLNRKSAQSDLMFKKLVELINHEAKIENKNKPTEKERIPLWL